MLGPGRDRNQRAREEIANAEARQFEKVDWKRDPGLRKLYFLAVVLWVASIITGYDGFVIWLNSHGLFVQSFNNFTGHC